MKPKIVLDESKFGVGLPGVWRWSFHEKNWRKERAAKPNDRDLDEDDSSLVTVTNNKEPILIAVTKKQYKSWSKRDIHATKRPRLKLWPRLFVRAISDWAGSIRNYISSHFMLLSKRYLYIIYLNHCVIVSKYGLRIIKPKRNIGLFGSLYEYYINYRRRNTGASRKKEVKESNKRDA